jgi:aspartate/methionine/tyrosine aminotransferase
MFASSRRASQIDPFYVMEIVKAAQQLEAAGRSIIHLSIGEPDFGAPGPVRDAARAAIESGDTGYTPALGLSSLRGRIADHYRTLHGVAVDPARIAVTAGASGALLLALAALLDEGHEVLMSDPSYPCNRHFVTALGGRARLLPCGPESRFQLTADAVVQAWRPKTAGVLLASPSNPTGTTIEPAALSALVDCVRVRGGFSVVDEIYLGLVYDHAPTSAIALAEDIVVVNSFSKYFGMTGWRLGWLVLPPGLIDVVERLAQNLYICASAIAQRAALACFERDSLALCESRRLEFKRRRDFLVPALRQLGMDVPVWPDGAFYVYADVSRLAPDSWDFSFNLLGEAGVCVVPGRDFGVQDPQRYVRISYATSMEKLEEAVARMGRFIEASTRSRGK